MTDSIFQQIKQLHRNISDQCYLGIRLRGAIQQSHTSKLFSLKFYSLYESKKLFPATTLHSNPLFYFL